MNQLSPLHDLSERDWPEDFGHENGRYTCGCIFCGKNFIGHKRRVVCKACDKRRDAAGENPK